MKIQKGDTVKMLYGKDSGRQGTVVAIDTKRGRVVVEGLNMYKKHLKGDGRTRVSEIVNITKSVPMSKVMLVCPECAKPIRIGYKIENGKKVRVCKKCNKIIISEKKEEQKEVKKTVKKTGSKKKNTKGKESKKSKSKESKK